MISKPSELTPLYALALAELCSRAKVPPGVFSVLPTAASRETCAKIAAHRDVRMITFTGSTRVGRALSALASQRMQRTAMELGGLASFIVCHDADIEKAVTGLIGAKFRNGGQSCVAVNRLYCHSEVADEFVSRLRERISEFVVIGDGFHPRTTVAPMINRDSVLRVEGLIDDAIEAGARLVYRAEIPDIPEQAAFCAPTLLVDVPKDSKVMRTEIFGPVVAVCTFTDYDEMIQDANNTEMGLASYVFSEGLGTAHKVTNALQVGMVGVNEVKLANWRTNFGGVKQSGIGREGAGDCALNCYTQLKYVLMKHS